MVMGLTGRVVVDPWRSGWQAGGSRGPRLAVELIHRLWQPDEYEDEFFDNYPGLTREDILACLSPAIAHEYKAFPVPA